LKPTGQTGDLFLLNSQGTIDIVRQNKEQGSQLNKQSGDKQKSIKQMCNRSCGFVSVNNKQIETEIEKK